MTANWFEAKISYMKIREDGKEKKVKESYLLDAMSYTEAEARIIKEMESTIRGDYYISGLKKSNIVELIPSDDEADDRWYKVKVDIVDTDESSGKEKLSSQYYLVAASNLRKAMDSIENSLSTFIVPYSISNITDTDFMDVFPYLSDEEVPDNFDSTDSGSPDITHSMIDQSQKLLILKKQVLHEININESAKMKYLEIKGIIEARLPMNDDNPIKVAIHLCKEYESQYMKDFILGTAGIMCK